MPNTEHLCSSKDIESETSTPSTLKFEACAYSALSPKTTSYNPHSALTTPEGCQVASNSTSSLAPRPCTGCKTLGTANNHRDHEECSRKRPNPLCRAARSHRPTSSARSRRRKRHSRQLLPPTALENSSPWNPAEGLQLTALGCLGFLKGIYKGFYRVSVGFV